MELDPEILVFFLEEAEENLETWVETVLEIEDSSDKDAYDKLFRTAHNLKGASRGVGLNLFGDFIHKVEDLIKLLNEALAKLTVEEVDILLEAQSIMHHWISELRVDPGFKQSIDEYLQRLDAIILKREKQSNEEQVLSSMESGEPAPNMELLAELGVTPEEADLVTAEAEVSSDEDESVDEVEAVEEPAEEEEESTPPPAKVRAFEEAPVAESPAKESKKASKEAQKKAVDETVRVSQFKIETLIEMLGELSIHQSIIDLSRRNRTLDSAIAQRGMELSHKIVKELHQNALSLRMQPVSTVFKRLERIAKDVARSQSKKILFETVGSHVELDKVILERIIDPLTHIVRNAIDHGIEDTEARAQTEKPEQASVVISATQMGGGVRISIKDDGKGMDPEVLIAKAKDKGVISKDAELNKQEALSLIFAAGFSTAAQVTDISGRGVGMDVVRRTLEEFGGTVMIDSDLGKGSTFHLMMPSTLSLINALIVEVHGESFAISLSELLEVVDIDGYEISTTTGKGTFLNLRGEVIPLEQLNSYLPPSKKQKVEKQNLALIVGYKGKKIALLFDKVSGQQTVVVKNLEGHFENWPGLSGNTILSDGEPGFIIDMQKVAGAYFEKLLGVA